MGIFSIHRLLAVALIGGGGISMLAAAPGPVSAGDAPSGSITVGLHNNTTENVQTCSEVPGLTTPAWHFVAPGGAILNIISLTVGGSAYTDPGFLPYPTDQHAYVEVRDGDEIGDLTAGRFEVTGTNKVVLSHTCTGTPPTTTTEKATTTTEKATTTTEKATSTTEKASTTTGKATTTTGKATTTIAPETASTAVVAGPTTAPPTTLATLATQLPATGSSSWTLFFVGLASALGGLGLIKFSRRPV